MTSNPSIWGPPDCDLSVCLVTDHDQCAAQGRDVVQTVRAAVAGGITAVQVREKTAGARDFVDVVVRVAAVLPARVSLIVNDRVDVYLAARERGADVTGVHLGQDDLPADLARRIVGPDAVIGLSASTADEIAAGCADPGVVSYLGVGALHGTPTKPDAPEPLGWSGLARAAAQSTLPVIAIGGITVADLPPLRQGGVAGVAVVSAICSAADPRAAAAELIATWRQA